MDLDQNVMIKAMGYTDLKAYYSATQCVGKLSKIKVPTFFLNCLDDPCTDKNLYPFKEFENSENVIAAFTTKGGHCGHYTGGFLRPY